MPRADLGGITNTRQLRRAAVVTSALAVLTTGPVASAAPAAPEDSPGETTLQFQAITAPLAQPEPEPAPSVVLGPVRQALGDNPALVRQALTERASRSASRTADRSRIIRPVAVVKKTRAKVVKHVAAAGAGRHRAAPAARHRTTVVKRVAAKRTVVHRAAVKKVRSTPQRVQSRRGLGAVVAFARAHVGHKYGGNWDCSGFTRQAYARIGVNLPHSSYAQAARARTISRSQARPGDLVVGPGHVGIYMGNGMMIDAGNHRVGVTYRRMYRGLHVERLV